MESMFTASKRNLKILKQKVAISKEYIADVLNLPSPKNVANLTMSKSDQNKLKLLESSKKFRKENNIEIIQDLTSLKETKIISFVDEEERKKNSIEDDLNLKEEIEGPKNDYCQHFVDTMQRPQNFIRDPGLQERFEEYPKLRELIKLKDDLISKTNAPSRPMYIKSDLLASNGNDFSLNDLIGCEFDVILIEPPLHEYQNNKVFFNRFYSWDEIKSIDVGSITASRSFIFLWCGSADGLDKGRECLKKWGFRRCEDICWIKTNKKSQKHNRILDSGSILQRTKEHCLMGIKGTVKRSQDSNFIHTNIDIDLIISEEPDEGIPDKPDEIFHIIEHFCLGRRRLYLFGRDNTLRHGWLTVGPSLSDTNFDKDLFKSQFTSGNLTGTSDRIELLRPKTPPIKTKFSQQQQQQQTQISNVNMDGQITFQSSAILPPPIITPNTNIIDLSNTISFNDSNLNQTKSDSSLLNPNVSLKNDTENTNYLQDC